MHWMVLLPCDTTRWVIFNNIFLNCAPYLLLALIHFQTVWLHKAPQSTTVGGDSSVGIVTKCGLEVSGFELRWWRSFSFPSRPVLDPAGPLYIGHLVILRGKVAGEWRWTSTPPSSVEVVNGWSYTSTPTFCLRGSLCGDLHLLTCFYHSSKIKTLALQTSVIGLFAYLRRVF